MRFCLLWSAETPLLDSVSIKHLLCIDWRDTISEHRLCILRDASRSWERIAQTLSMPQELIFHFHCQTPHKSLQDCASDVFKWWFNSDTTKYNKTWAGLYQLLNDSDLSGLAEQLKEAILNPMNSVRISSPYKTTKRVVKQRKRRKTSGASNY